MRAALLMTVLLLSCVGQDAGDPAICRDYIHRVCIPVVCDPVKQLYPSNADCEATFIANTGCGSDDFLFTTPTRDKFLRCRLPLLEVGLNVEARPECADIAASFADCPEVVRMLQGLK